MINAVYIKNDKRSFYNLKIGINMEKEEFFINPIFSFKVNLPNKSSARSSGVSFGFL
mgnify:CR=1 FL=1